MKEHLYNKFVELADHCGWDSEIQGNNMFVLFSTANKHHLDEFIGLCALMPNIECKEINSQISNTWCYEVRHLIDSYDEVQLQAYNLKSTFKG